MYAEEFLICIRDELESKYGISDPIFILYNNQRLSEKELNSWIGRAESEMRWVYYTRIDGNRIFLKDFLPSPSKEVCMKAIRRFIAERKRDPKQKMFFKIGSAIHPEKDAIGEMLSVLLLGYPLLYGKHIEDPQNIERSVYIVEFLSDEIHSELKSGYRALKYQEVK